MYRSHKSIQYVWTPAEWVIELDHQNIAIDLFIHELLSLGNEVVIVKNGTRICGSGGVLCSAPIVQNKCYFEVKVQQSGN